MSPQVLAVSLSTSSVHVDGLALASLTVTTTVSGWPDDLQSVFLTRTSAASEPSATTYMVAVMQRSSGDPGSGTYSGTVYVASTAGGSWRVSTISDAGPAEPDGGVVTDRDPRADGVALTAGAPPAPSPSGRHPP